MKFKRNIKIIKIKVLYFVINHFKKKPEHDVIAAFSEKHPNSHYPVWHKTKDGFWEVSFNENIKQAIAVFNTEGKWLESRFNTQFLLLPKSVREAFESRFNKELIMDIYELKFKKTDIYEFLINENNRPKSLLFSTSGLLISSGALENHQL